MQEHDTFPGKVYAVTCASGCTITDNQGRTLGECEAGKQTLVVATSDKLMTSADALVTATFNLAPVKLRLLGLLGGGASTVKKLTLEEALALASLPDGGGKMSVSLPWDAQFADTGVPDALQIAADKGWVIKVQYRDGAESERYSRYATCTTVADIAAINPNFRTDLTADGGWIYPLPELTNLANIAWGGNYSPDMPIKYLDCDAPKVKFANPGFVHTSQPKWARGDWSGVLNGTWMFGSANKKTLMNVEMVFPKLQSGDAMFYYAMLNKESVLRILGSIPSYTSGTHKLTIGIHVDHEFDEEVEAAIADAEAKGWTIEKQWNGTATAQVATYRLRRKPIYAKVGTMELPDGTTGQYLSWGHYVTNWAENGYMEFASVEEANAYFGIQEELLTAYNENE